MHSLRALLASFVLVAGLALAGVALAKEIDVTTCGKNRCRTVTNAIVGIATVPGAVRVPRDGRFYTIELKGPYGWKIAYEAHRGLVRAADLRARLTMGLRWSRLTPDTRRMYARTVRGLAPMRAPPPYRD
jgi:hypothetical protein